ncbi:MAG: hypothetical protein L6W00_18180 [Lentisphaeria bacterium]|nr:MAG: hypothetical protein L6W00_18180 [Lentisphaeria bacterium]
MKTPDGENSLALKIVQSPADGKSFGKQVNFLHKGVVGKGWKYRISFFYKGVSPEASPMWRRGSIRPIPPSGNGPDAR